eukprot:1180686-Prorocentrum_minimum.AAC.8
MQKTSDVSGGSVYDHLAAVVGKVRLCFASRSRAVLIENIHWFKISRGTDVNPFHASDDA